MGVGRPGSFQLGVDLGTSNTVAMLAWPDGRSRPLLFDGSPLMPSAVCRSHDGTLLVGRDAVNAASAYPDGFEPHPKRRIDDGVLFLGGEDVPLAEAIGAVLGRVLDEARRVGGAMPAQMVLTHPVAWAARRREVLLAGAARLGVDDVVLVPEPVAAGYYLVEVLGQNVPFGHHMLVYDLGAGTFDASMLRRRPDGFEVVASQGLADAGGLDIDASVLAHLAAVSGDRTAWSRLTSPVTPADRRSGRLAWNAVREAKEGLSRTASTLVHLPGVERDFPLVRDELDQLAREILARTVAVTRAVVTGARVSTSDIAAILLVGGASRMPLAATLLHREFGLAPTAIEQPELVVAEGSLRAVPPAADTVLFAAAVGGQPPVARHEVLAPPPSALPPPDPQAQPARTARRLLARRSRITLGVCAVAVAALAAASGLIFADDQRTAITSLLDGGDTTSEGGRTSTHQANSTVTTAPPPNGSVPPAGSVLGSTNPGTGQPSGRPASGSTQAAEGTQNGPAATTAAPPAPAGVLGPEPEPKSTKGSTSTTPCQIVGLRMTRMSGSGTTWPTVAFNVCTAGSGTTRLYAYSRLYISNRDAIGADPTLRYTARVELRNCSGSGVESKSVGPAESPGPILIMTDNETSPASAQGYAVAQSVEVRAGGTTWKAATDNVTSACKTL
jgi:hypothetical protein